MTSPDYAFKTIIDTRSKLTQAYNHRLAGPTAMDVAQGLVEGTAHVNKFGETTNADSGVDTDIWDGANASDDIAIHVAPTAARIHAITSTVDTDATAAVGAKTLRVFGLTSWAAKEVSEDVDMNGTTGTNTVNSYVFIHRMQVLTSGAAGPNVGVIKATAASDNSVSAMIGAGVGQTLMAIYAIPSTQTAYITNYYASIEKPAANTVAEISLLVNPTPDSNPANFLHKHIIGVQSDGSNYVNHPFGIPLSVAGPAIIKMHTNTGANDTKVAGGFDLVLVDN